MLSVAVCGRRWLFRSRLVLALLCSLGGLAWCSAESGLILGAVSVDGGIVSVPMLGRLWSPRLSLRRGDGLVLSVAGTRLLRLVVARLGGSVLLVSGCLGLLCLDLRRRGG